jgi:hypothetical protein
MENVLMYSSYIMKVLSCLSRIAMINYSDRPVFDGDHAAVQHPRILSRDPNLTAAHHDQ